MERHRTPGSHAFGPSVLRVYVLRGMVGVLFGTQYSILKWLFAELLDSLPSLPTVGFLLLLGQWGLLMQLQRSSGRHSRIRLAEAFVHEAIKLRDNPLPCWCARLNADEVQRYAQTALGGLRALEQPETPAVSPSHSVLFYKTEEELADDVAAYLALGLHAGEGAVVIATSRHWSHLVGRLATHGVDAAALESNGQILALDCRTTLNALMKGGTTLDPARFYEVVGSALASIKARHPRVRLFGEMVDVLWENGQPGLALELERLWNAFLAGTQLHLRCAYAAPKTEEERQRMAPIEHEHAAAA